MASLIQWNICKKWVGLCHFKWWKGQHGEKWWDVFVMWPGVSMTTYIDLAMMMMIITQFIRVFIVWPRGFPVLGWPKGPFGHIGCAQIEVARQPWSACCLLVFGLISQCLLICEVSCEVAYFPTLLVITQSDILTLMLVSCFGHEPSHILLHRTFPWLFKVFFSYTH